MANGERKMPSDISSQRPVESPVRLIRETNNGRTITIVSFPGDFAPTLASGTVTISLTEGTSK